MSLRALRAFLVAALVLAGCGSSTLDRQQQEAAARACASLVERGAARRQTPVKVAGEIVDLRANPEGFYEVLQEERGPEFFPVDDPDDQGRTQNDQISKNCRVESVSSSADSTTSGG